MDNNLSIPQGMDAGAVNLARAIRQKESGGNYNATGDGGTSAGAYQWNNGKVPLQPGEIPANFQSNAKQYGLDPNDFSPSNQDMVAYHKILDYKNQGYNVPQIAAAWNSGSPTGWENKVGTTTINGQQVHYDVPAYAQSVNDLYQDYKQQSNVSQDNTSNNQIGNIADTIKSGIGSVYNSLASPLISLAATPVQALAKAIGQPDPYAKGIPSPVGATNTPVSQLGLEQKAGDIAQVGSYFIPGGTLPRLAGMGALQGAGQSMSKGENASNIATSATTGGILGGALGAAGSLISKLADILPQRIVRQFIPGINPETAEYAVNKGLNSPTKMLQDSDNSISTLGNQLGTVLNDDKYKNITASGNDIFTNAINKFPDAGLTTQDIANNLKSIIPLKSSLIDKLSQGDLSLPELQNLNSALGKNTFKTVFDDPTTKAGKEIGAGVYHTISDFIKTNVPESEPLYDQLTKEYPLNKALNQVIRRGEKARSFTLRDLVALTVGSIGGPMGSLGTLAAEKALVNPTVNLTGAGLISKLANPAFQRTTTQVTKGIIPSLIQKMGSSSSKLGNQQ